MTPFYKEYRVIGAKVEITAGLREDQNVATSLIVKCVNDALSETVTAVTPTDIIANGAHYQYAFLTKN